MTSYITFSNKGLINMRAITTFGVSSKENDSAIGFFGTGFKYALAILLRERQDICILRGDEKEYNFSHKTLKVRVDEFDFIYMNEKELNFTTDLGKTWNLWQAYRELYCNCIDEFGKVEVSTEKPLPESGITKVIVTGDAFHAVHLKRDEFILSGERLFTSETLEVLERKSTYTFYRGIRAGNLELPSLFTWNILSKLNLTEDRTIEDPWDARRLASAFLFKHCKDESFIRECLLAPDNYWENRISFEYLPTGKPSDEFISVVTPYLNDVSGNMNLSAIKRVQRLNPIKRADVPRAVLTSVETTMLSRAIDFCKKIDFPVDDFPIIVLDSLGPRILGLAEDRQIFLTKAIFRKGTKYVAAGLVEEWTHIFYDCHDCSREMQTIFLERIVSLGELVVGEPV